jgi:glucosamine 6-phosphate synthetase-like amidotransferase/phosphosugar isomerase protein
MFYPKTISAISMLSSPNVAEPICLPSRRRLADLLLAYHMAVALGHNFDKSCNIAKSVTVK